MVCLAIRLFGLFLTESPDAYPSLADARRLDAGLAEDGVRGPGGPPAADAERGLPSAVRAGLWAAELPSGARVGRAAVSELDARARDAPVLGERVRRRVAALVHG